MQCINRLGLISIKSNNWSVLNEGIHLFISQVYTVSFLYEGEHNIIVHSHISTYVTNHTGHSKLFFHLSHVSSSAGFTGIHTRIYCHPEVLLKHHNTTAICWLSSFSFLEGIAMSKQPLSKRYNSHNFYLSHFTLYPYPHYCK